MNAFKRRYMAAHLFELMARERVKTVTRDTMSLDEALDHIQTVEGVYRDAKQAIGMPCWNNDPIPFKEGDSGMLWYDQSSLSMTRRYVVEGGLFVIIDMAYDTEVSRFYGEILPYHGMRGDLARIHGFNPKTKAFNRLFDKVFNNLNT